MGKEMKAKKPKAKSKVASGRYAKALVLRGSKEKTTGGLKKEALIKNKRGKVVSQKASAAGKKAYENIKKWTESVNEARKALNMEGFVSVNGKSSMGQALYVKAKSLHALKK